LFLSFEIAINKYTNLPSGTACTYNQYMPSVQIDMKAKTFVCCEKRETRVILRLHLRE